MDCKENKTNEYYKHFYDTAPIGFYRTSISDGKLIQANPLCCKMLGCDSEKKLSEYCAYDYYADPKDRDKFIGLLSKNGGELHVFEVQFKIPATADHQKNDTIWVALTGRINKEKGYIEGSIMDITYRKQIEDENKNLKSREIVKSNKTTRLGDVRCQRKSVKKVLLPNQLLFGQ